VCQIAAIMTALIAIRVPAARGFAKTLRRIKDLRFFWLESPWLARLLIG
jgi:hypothetical protein